MKTLLLLTAILLVIFLQICAFNVYAEEEFAVERMFNYTKDNCKYQAIPGMDNDTKNCCERIYVNYCIEKKYKLKYTYLLQPVIEKQCRKHLEDPKASCNIDTTMYGYTMTKYSLCYLKYQFMLDSLFNPEGEVLNVVYYDNFKESKREGMGNRTFCCFQKKLCECFDETAKPGCKQAQRQVGEVNTVASYCDCEYFSNNQVTCPQKLKCRRVSKKRVMEERNYLTFGTTMLILVVTNYGLVMWCCYDSQSLGKRKKKPSLFKRFSSRISMMSFRK